MPAVVASARSMAPRWRERPRSGTFGDDGLQSVRGHAVEAGK